MADISKIKLPSGTVYNIKDATARQDIQNLQNLTTGAMHYIGITTTTLTDGATTSPIEIEGNTVTPSAGSVAIYGEKEYVWNGSKWQEFGSTGSLKALAFKDSASASYKPEGSVSQPTFSGTEATIEASYTPSGSVSQPTFSGKAATITSNSYTPAGNVTLAVGTGTANYTPDGTISKPTTTVTLNTTTVNSITNVGTLPTCTLPELDTAVANETLELAWTAGSFSQGTLPTKGANQTVATTVKSADTTAPTFSGAAVELKPTFSGTAATITSKYTPEGSVSQPTFSGAAGTATATYTPAGDVSKPTFSGTTKTITVS